MLSKIVFIAYVVIHVCILSLNIIVINFDSTIIRLNEYEVTCEQLYSNSLFMNLDANTQIKHYQHYNSIFIRLSNKRYGI